eukprot:TRINITY_DN865_c2_g1_i1.p3 TRINITY_DN865_c2_g1~~TRINITY_DN865_c2_g1_i1.p3  ORF type:complete len:136 (-),score=27.27 TRINITY_DN865_c2_g1_i1:420-827(-)
MKRGSAMFGPKTRSRKQHHMQSGTESASAMERLPSEVIAVVLSMLPAVDVCRLGMTCRRLLASAELELRRCASAYEAAYGLTWDKDILSHLEPNAASAFRSAADKRSRLMDVGSRLRLLAASGSLRRCAGHCLRV